MKKRIATGILIIVLLLGTCVAIASCNNNNNSNNSNNNIEGSNNDNNKEPVAPKGVGTITSNNQKSGNTTYTNYLVKITNEIDWNTITREEKQVIINYVINEINKRNDENSIKYFNITGVLESGESAFMYDRVNDEMVTLKNGEQEFRFPMPINK